VLSAGPHATAAPDRPAAGRTGAPEVSVAIVSFDCREHLTRCLESLEARERGFGLEVIVVDNASTDGTAALVAERFPWVRLVTLGENAGFARATNLAIAEARGRHLLLLNPDTIVPPGALERAVAELDRRPEVGMLGCKLVRPDGTLDHACKRGFPTPLSALAHFAGLTRRAPRSRRLAGYTAGHLGENETGEVDAVNGAMMLVRREALAAVGPLDEDYWLYMEDLDWCYRFWQAGWPVLYWPEVEIVHVKAGSSGKHRSWKANRAFHEGMWLFYRKHYAAERSALVNAAVWAGIWTKLGISAARSLASRAGRGR
jgi:GT2 family glycosyltransferase